MRGEVLSPVAVELVVGNGEGRLLLVWGRGPDWVTERSTVMVVVPDKVSGVGVMVSRTRGRVVNEVTGVVERLIEPTSGNKEADVDIEVGKIATDGMTAAAFKPPRKRETHILDSIMVLVSVYA